MFNSCWPESSETPETPETGYWALMWDVVPQKACRHMLRGRDPRDRMLGFNTDMEDLSDYSVYSQLTDDELMQLAVERSLSDPPPSPDPPTPPDIPKCDPFNALYKGSLVLYRRHYGGGCCCSGGLGESGVQQSPEPNDEGWIALHEAAYYGQLHCLAILIKAHPNLVNSWSLTNQTALLLAAGRGNVSCVDFLLKHGADPNIADRDRETPLLTACEQPNEAVVDLLLQFGAQVNRCTVQGETCLHVACRHGQLELCRKLLEAGADLNRKNIYGIQPIFTAAQHGHADIIRLLASKGADINGQDVKMFLKVFLKSSNSSDFFDDPVTSTEAVAASLSIFTTDNPFHPSGPRHALSHLFHVIGTLS
ncbi:ankyrin repeat and SOCS box protein 2 [Etheostoma spectabile]|uniref:ankyrin repeat and SOCS box protein 2 n=1 Tax=Etheostoma spectabile TaxID=54343 RepID=UPI0013AEEB0E|nr:ankyrin repeat and SOCS box protein 2-like [Etheostoma spectabile]